MQCLPSCNVPGFRVSAASAALLIVRACVAAEKASAWCRGSLCATNVTTAGGICVRRLCLSLHAGQNSGHHVQPHWWHPDEAPSFSCRNRISVSCIMQTGVEGRLRCAAQVSSWARVVYAYDCDNLVLYLPRHGACTVLSNTARTLELNPLSVAIL